MFNINLWIEKITKLIKDSLQESKNIMLDNWQKYNKTATKYMESVKEYEELNDYFKQGDWTTHERV